MPITPRPATSLLYWTAGVQPTVSVVQVAEWARRRSLAADAGGTMEDAGMPMACSADGQGPGACLIDWEDEGPYPAGTAGADQQRSLLASVGGADVTTTVSYATQGELSAAQAFAQGVADGCSWLADVHTGATATGAELDHHPVLPTSPPPSPPPPSPPLTPGCACQLRA